MCTRMGSILFLFTLLVFTGCCKKKNPTEVDIQTMTDIDGNVYDVVKIGDQWWMAENLKVTHYRNGEAIPEATMAADTWSGSSSGVRCVYDDEEINADTCGYLYNWYAVTGSCNIAPEGWHVPTDADWKELEMALGMSQADANDSYYRGGNQGSKLAGDAGIWVDGTLDANPAFGESGFCGLPGGYRGTNPAPLVYHGKGYSGHFWSTTECDSTTAWERSLYYNYSRIGRIPSDKAIGCSVRLVRD